MKKLIVLMVLVPLLASCGSNPQLTANGPQGQQGPQGIPGQSGSVVSQPESVVQAMVDQENLYRASVGQEPLTPGLACYLYTIPQTTTSIATATGLVGVGSFEFTGSFSQPQAPVTAGFQILPQALQGVYQTWFEVKCYGTLVVTDSNWHEFDLTSDDGANLYMDGLTINNDGLHATKTVTTTQYLKYGLHSFELDFFQGAGQQVLILNEDGSVMDNGQYYH